MRKSQFCRTHWKLALWLVAALAIGFSGGSAMAAIVPVGDPIEGSSWSQGFNESGVGNFDRVEVIWVSGSLLAGQSSLPAGWTVILNNPYLSIATGSSATSNMTWNISFQGNKSSSLSFYFKAWEGASLKEEALAVWNGSSWTITTPHLDLNVHNITQGISYATIGAAVAAANSNDVITVDPGTYPEGIVTIGVNLTIQASISSDPPTITPTTNTGGSGDARGWFLIDTGYSVNFSHLNFNGASYLIHTAIRHHGAGVIDHCAFSNIGYAASSYDGRAVQSDADYAFTIEDCQFSNIYRIGMFIFGSNMSTKICQRNTYTGKGDGDWLDYGIELGGGAVATVENNTITNCTGVASVDGSVSAGILATTYFGSGTAGVFNGNILTGNSYGLAVGYDEYDGTVASAYSNKMESIHEDVSSISTVTVDASGNWWGQATEPTQLVALSAPANVRPSSADGVAAPANRALDADYEGSVDYTPWLNSSTDISGDPGFQGDFSVLNVGAGGSQTGTVGRVQEGINMVTGSTVYLAPGIYVEQVKIQSEPDMHLIGSGVATTTIKCPAAVLDPFYEDRRAVLSIENSTAHISDLTVDGDGQANINSRMMGIAFWNSSGSLTDMHVTKVRETPLSGGQQGVGVYSWNNSTGPFTIDVTDVIVDDYQKNAFALNSNDNLTCDLLRVTTIGAGPLNYQAQNGIQFGWGTGGTITDCNVSGNFYSASGWASTGILLYLAGSTTVSGGTLSDNQTGLDFANTSGSASGITVNGPSTRGFWVEGVMAENYSGYSLSGGRPRPHPVDAEFHSENMQGGGTLDANQTVSFSGLTCTGQDRDSSIAIYFWANFDQITGTISDCDLVDWEQGVAVEEAGSGQISVAMTGSDLLSNTDYGLWNNTGTLTDVSDNRFVNNSPAYNCWDDQSGNSYDANCYSDFGSNGGFPTQYDIPGGGGNVDANPNVNDCADVDFVMTSDLIGCPGGCADDTLYLRLDRSGFYSGQLILQLPPEISSYLTASMSDVAPPSGPLRTANLQNTFARLLSGNQIELNPLWGAVAPSVADGKYFACIPVYNTSGTHALVLDITPVSYDFADASGEHTNDLCIGMATVTVDCDAPSATLGGGGGAGGCNAYGDAGSFNNELSYTMAALGAGGPPASPLASAYMKLGTQAWALPLANGTFPTGSESPSVWTTMAEGCNTFEIHVFDTECNEKVVSLDGAVKDTSAPSPSVSYAQSACYNNIPGDPQYGATLLDGDLDIDLAAALTCEASTFSLSFTVNSTPVAEGLSGVASITDYPFDTHAQELWDDIVGVIGTSYSGSVTIGWSVTDCAGNAATGSFSVPCVDFVAPDNTFTVFDARPTHLGVWLNWNWSGATGATAMEVWRKPEWVTGDPADDAYPVYNSNKSLSDANYDKVHANLLANDWTIVATQTGVFTSADYHGGSDIHHGTYWKDDIGTDDTPLRSIYRYVTFVRDAVGNWSTVAPSTYTLTANADRSTNYWLGDYAPLHGLGGPTGYVDGPDLTLLSAHYFEAVGPATSYLDIGPENHENGYGKGIPNPDQQINFYDLLPFSFNFGIVTPGGFNIHFPDTKPFSNLDEQPVVSVCRGENAKLSVGDNFKVTVALSGNDEHSVKAVEAELRFDPQVIKLVTATEGAIEVMDGVPFALTRPIEGRENAVGIAAAAMGEMACISGNFALATIEFQWISEQTSTTEIQLTSILLADGQGNIIEGTGTTLTITGADAVPLEFALYQNYPNPFNPSTQIHFDLAEASAVRLLVFNVLGQKVRTLVAANMPAGRHQIAWDGRDDRGLDVSSGLYLYKLQAGSFVSCRKMLLTR
jgi:hypothetical protein